MVISNSSSSSMTSSTMSRESAPMSSVKEVERVTCSLFTPRFSQTIAITRSSTEATIQSSKRTQAGPRKANGEIAFLALGYVPQFTLDGQGNLDGEHPHRLGGRLARTQKGKNMTKAE